MDIVFDYSNTSELQKFLLQIYGIKMLPKSNMSSMYGNKYKLNQEEMQRARKKLSRELVEYDQLGKHSANDAIDILKMKAVNKQNN